MKNLINIAENVKCFKRFITLKALKAVQIDLKLSVC